MFARKIPNIKASQILENIQNAVFTIMIDETADISGKEQIVVFVGWGTINDNVAVPHNPPPSPRYK